MAAVTTYDPDAVASIELGFPRNYEDAYPFFHTGFRDAPTKLPKSADLVVGDDFQARLHQAINIEENRARLQGLADNKKAKKLALSSYNQIYGMPPLVRPKYGNANYGGTFGNAETPRYLEGGVLRSKEGQEYIAKLLAARVKQLDAIDTAQDESKEGATFSSIPSKETETGVDVKPETKKQLELINLLNLLSDTVYDPDSIGRLDLKDIQKLVSTLIDVAPVADRETLEDAIEAVDNALETMRQIDVDSVRQVFRASVKLIQDILPRIRTYLDRMYFVVNRSPRERKLASKNALKTSGLLRWRKLGLDVPRVPQFTRVAEDREDLENPEDDRVMFTPSNTEVFGNRSGTYYGRDFDTSMLPTTRNELRRQNLEQRTAEERAIAAERFVDTSIPGTSLAPVIPGAITLLPAELEEEGEVAPTRAQRGPGRPRGSKDVRPRVPRGTKKPTPRRFRRVPLEKVEEEPEKEDITEDLEGEGMYGGLKPPFKLRKVRNQNLYFVVAADGKKHSNKPMSKERAKEQQKALYAAASREKISMPKGAFEKEHRNLIKVLTKGSKAQQMKEAKEQKKELSKYKL